MKSRPIQFLRFVRGDFRGIERIDYPGFVGPYDRCGNPNGAGHTVVHRCVNLPKAERHFKG